MNHAEHARNLAALAEAQRDNARQLAEAVTEASAAGLPWRQIGEALGIGTTVVFRQHKAGSVISVLRPVNRAAEPDKAEALAEVAEARAAAERAAERLAGAVERARALGCPQAAIGRARQEAHD